MADREELVEATAQVRKIRQGVTKKVSYTHVTGLVDNKQSRAWFKRG